jgi:hypothetical protein
MLAIVAELLCSTIGCAAAGLYRITSAPSHSCAAPGVLQSASTDHIPIATTPQSSLCSRTPDPYAPDLYAAATMLPTQL